MRSNVVWPKHDTRDVEDYKNLKESCSFVVHNVRRGFDIIRPYRPIDNWRNGRRIPLICVLEVMILAGYLLLGIIHLATTNRLSLNFKWAINRYFYEGYGFDEPDDDDTNIYIGKIFFKSDLLSIAQSTAQRLFSFANDFICTKPFYASDTYTATLRMVSGDSVSCSFSSDNSSVLNRFIEIFIDDIAQLSLNMNYDIQSDIGDQELRIQMKVFIVFTLDPYSDTIFFTLYHERLEKEVLPDYNDMSMSVLKIFPTFNVILGCACILLTLQNSYEVYLYSKKRAESNFQTVRHVFHKKFDKWNIYGLFCHTLTIISCVCYLESGMDYTVEVPYTTVLLAFSGCAHAFLMMRYLRHWVSVMIAINMAGDQAAEMGEFIFGCLMILFGYQLFGMSVFGIYYEKFMDPRLAITLLYCIIQGDNMHLRMTELNNRCPCNPWIIPVFILSWTVFGMVIVNNIALSVSEASLIKEICNAASVKNAPLRAGAVGIKETAIPVSYKNVF